MRLPVIPTAKVDQPWYGTALSFTCTCCGNCCTGPPGFVWISDVEQQRLADFLKLTVEEIIERFGRRIGRQISLKEHRNSAGNYDCIFLREEPAPPRADGTIPLPIRTCAIYSVRPLQCRTWPFWEGNLRDRDSWDRAAARCPGMNTGRRYSRKQIESLRDAEDWPKAPPTSA